MNQPVDHQVPRPPRADLPPVTYTVAQGQSMDGHYVTILTARTVHGPLTFVLPPDAAVDLGGHLTRIGRMCRLGMAVTDATPPDLT